MIRIPVVPLFFILPFCFGCGQKLPSDLPPLFPTTLVIVQEGKPLADAVITMTTSESKWSVTGMTNSQGEAKMFVNGTYEGAPEGEFKVIVNKTETEKPNIPPPPSDADPNAMSHYNEKIAPLLAQAKTYNLVEPVNGTFETTPLAVSVVRGTSRYSLDIGKAVRIEVKQRRLD